MLNITYIYWTEVMQMKKFFALCLMVVLCFCCLTSCGSAHEENTWFSEEKLAECIVADLPTIEKDYVNHNDDIYVSFTDSEFKAYAKSVYDYLLSQEYKYLGTRGEQKNTLSGVFTTYYFEPATELESFRVIEGDYVFVFSDGSTDENGDVEFLILVIYDVSTNTLEYGNKKFTYNTQISLRRGSEAPLGGFYVLKEEEHEHTYEYNHDNIGHGWSYTCGCMTPPNFAQHFDGDGDGKCDEDSCGYEYAECDHQWDDGVEIEGGLGGYVMEYTCTLCGDKKRETITIIPPSGASHSITYQSDRTAEFLIEGFAPTEAKPGDTVVLRTYRLMDANLAFYANGVKLTLTYADYDYWEYVFIMPDEDVVITHKITNGFLPD